MVGLGRFELPYDRYERSVLPLDDSPIKKGKGHTLQMAMPDRNQLASAKGVEPLF